MTDGFSLLEMVCTCAQTLKNSVVIKKLGCTFRAMSKEGSRLGAVCTCAHFFLMDNLYRCTLCAMWRQIWKTNNEISTEFLMYFVSIFLMWLFHIKTKKRMKSLSRWCAHVHIKKEKTDGLSMYFVNILTNAFSWKSDPRKKRIAQVCTCAQRPRSYLGCTLWTFFMWPCHEMLILKKSYRCTRCAHVHKNSGKKALKLDVLREHFFRLHG